MKRLYHFVGVLAMAAAFCIPASAHAAELETGCSQAAQNAEHLSQLAAEIAHVGNRIESSGSELASHIQGQHGLAIRSDVQRTSEHIRVALRDLQGALESTRASCEQYRPPDEHVLHPMDMGMLRKGEQPWNIVLIEAGASDMRASREMLNALTNDVRSTRGEFGDHRDRALAELNKALVSLTRANQTLGEVVHAMHEGEQCISGRFSDGTNCKPRR